MAVDQFDIIGQEGQAASLRAVYINSAGQYGNAGTGTYEAYSGTVADYYVDGITEGDPGHFLLTRPAWVTEPGKVRVWNIDTGTVEWVGSLSDSSTAVVTEDGDALPATRTLWFRFKSGNPPVATDVTGLPQLLDPTGTFGVRRQSTGAVVVPASPVQSYTRLSTGVYYYELPETGTAYEYGVTYVNPDTGATESALLFSAPPSFHYASADDVDKELLGSGNTALQADGDADGAADPGMVESALGQSDVRVNLKLGAYSPPPSAFPVTSTATWVTDAIRTAAAKYAAGYLLNKRDRQARQVTAQGQLSDGDVLIRDGDELLQMLIDAGLPGVTLDDEDETPPAGSFEFVPITRTVCDASTDENYRPPLWYGSN